MIKVLIAFEGTNLSLGAFEFAKELNKRQHILLIGIFLSPSTYSGKWSYTDAARGFKNLPRPDPEDEDKLLENIEKFKTLCVQHNINYFTRQIEDDFLFHQLKDETRFADLLILGSENFYDNTVSQGPEDELTTVLHLAECPVLLVPEKFKFPKGNIFAYDGSASAAFTLKQYSYIFTSLRDKPSFLVYAGKTKTIPEILKMAELAGQHFTNLSVVHLNSNPKQEILTWLTKEPSAILVAGSFGRSSFSEFFKSSFSSEIIKEHKMPVFIAHR
jgi:nucleotide-binding universal stress UspA family protein